MKLLCFIVFNGKSRQRYHAMIFYWTTVFIYVKRKENLKKTLKAIIKIAKRPFGRIAEFFL